MKGQDWNHETCFLVLFIDWPLFLEGRTHPSGKEQSFRWAIAQVSNHSVTPSWEHGGVKLRISMADLWRSQPGWNRHTRWHVLGDEIGQDWTVEALKVSFTWLSLPCTQWHVTGHYNAGSDGIWIVIWQTSTGWIQVGETNGSETGKVIWAWKGT